MKYSISGPVLVTGGAGFIGSHIVDRLVNDGIETVALDNLSTGMISNLANNEGKKKFSFIKEDMCNSKGVRNTLKGIKTVFHMAADPEVRTGFENPESTYRENLKNTFYLLEEIRKHDETVPFLYTTGHYESEDLLRAIKLGVTEFFVKPLDAKEIISYIQKFYYQH